ncbi:MAG TPA: putative zinc-binding metallopeptidase [Acidimicrobiia bacterium]|nr:putative zinc-binding metallopeptidase [Acidimicrobiia bacterium]
MKRRIITTLVIVFFVIGCTGAYFLLTSDGEKKVSVYETEVNSKDDCSSYEEYDSARKVCYFECEDEIECEKISALIDKEFKAYMDEYAENQPSDSSDDQPADDREDKNVRAEYSVSTGEKISFAGGQEDEKDQDIWNQIKNISPNDLTNTYIDTFQVFDNTKDDTLAYVSDDNGDGKFEIAINSAQHAMSSSKEQTLTIVHELTHIITLNIDQQGDEGCGGYVSEDGCFPSTSIMGSYVSRFWSADLIAQSKSGDIDYERNKKTYVSEYATTSPEEDIAESFAFYVVNSSSSSQSIAEQKQAFFNDFDDLVSIKKQMRQAVGRVLLRKDK